MMSKAVMPKIEAYSAFTQERALTIANRANAGAVLVGKEALCGASRRSSSDCPAY
jgi:hypothetical protein